MPHLRRVSPAGGSRGRPPAKTTIMTRDEDLNIEEFMREDMYQINKDEDRL